MNNQNETRLARFEQQFGLTVNNEGKIVTTSLKVANVYGKEHADVMRKIRKFIDLIPELGLGNFAESSYLNEQNKSQPMYIMDRQGFAMLVNKFTGDEATIFTYQYTKAFEEMTEEIRQLREDIKIVSNIALSDQDQSQRLLEMNEHDFSVRRTQRSFASCSTYEEYKQMFNRFMDYTKGLEAETRLIRYESAIKGMEKLRVNLLMSGAENIGNTINIDSDIKNLLRQIDKVNNRISGGEKSAQTKKIKNLELKMCNSLLLPTKDQYIKLNVHGFSNNYMYADKLTQTRKSPEYIRWLEKFPNHQVAPKEYFDVDWNKPIEIFLNYVLKSSFDHMNCDKSIIDNLFQRFYNVDDNIIAGVYSHRGGTCDDYRDGTISYFIRNVIK